MNYEMITKLVVSYGLTSVQGCVNRLTPTDANLHQICVFHYQRILPDSLKHNTD